MHAPIFPLVAIALLAGCLPAEVVTLKQVALSDELTFLEGGGGNSVVLTHGSTTLVFDTKTWPWSSDVARFVQRSHPGRVFVVNSHAHSDHSGGNDLFPSATIVAAPEVAAELAVATPYDEAPGRVGVPTLIVARKLRLLLDDEPVILVHPKPAHTSGDLYAWLPESRTLVTGDLYDNGYYPHVDEGRGGTYVGYLASLEQLATYPAEVIIPGHGPQAKRSDLQATLAFLRSIRNTIQRDRAAGMSDDAILGRLTPSVGEPLSNLGLFSSREKVVRGFLSELPRP